MFDYEARSIGFSPLLFVLQLVVAPLGGLIFGLILSLVLEAVLHVKESNSVLYLSFALQGFLLGYKIQARVPHAIQSFGKWVWIPPFCILAWSFLYELWLFPSSAVHDQFWPGSGDPGGAYLIILVTLPVVASAFYSIGVIAANRAPTSSWQQAFHSMMAGKTTQDSKPPIDTTR